MASTSTTTTDQLQAAEGLNALSWVQDDLRRALEAAHKALRRYLKAAATATELDPVDPAILSQARTQLHQAAGAAELVGLGPPTQVLKAAEAALLRLTARGTGKGLTEAAVQAIEHGSFAVLDYIARQLAGKSVTPVLLFPQYRALQELAGASRIHPADLWPVGFEWRNLPLDPGVSARTLEPGIVTAVETDLLGLMRGAPPSVAARMSEVFSQLAAGLLEPLDLVEPGTLPADHPRERQLATLWQLAAALFEAQADVLLKPDIHSKRLLSRLLAQLRRGPAAEADARLAHDLLYFCGQALPREGGPGVGSGGRLRSVQRAYQLEPESPLDLEVVRLGRFDPAWITQGRRRVEQAKDVWSAVAGGDLTRLGGLVDQIGKVADSLERLYPQGQVLGRALHAAAQHTAQSQAEPSAELAMEVATALLYVEASLDDAEFDQPETPQRIQRLAVRIDQVRQNRSPGVLELWMEDLYRRVSDRQSIGNVVQELRASLSEVEKAIDAYFRNPRQRDKLFPVSAQLQSMRGVLSVLGLDQASHAVQRMSDDVDALADTEADPERAARNGSFDRLADNLGALSFLIDMVAVQPQMAKSLFRFDASAGRLIARMQREDRPSGYDAFLDDPEPPQQQSSPDTDAVAVSLEFDRMVHRSKAQRHGDADRSPGSTGLPMMAGGDALTELAPDAGSDDQADTAGARSDGPAKTGGAASAAVPTGAEPAASAADAPPAPEAKAEDGRWPVRPGQDLSPGFRRSTIEAAADVLRPAPAEPRAPEPPAIETDPEMREVFLEEAEEVLQTARQKLGELERAPSDRTLIVAVRRAFHTLKGSARMVGLGDFGEAAWACEQLYNARLADQRPSVDERLQAFSRDAIAYFERWVASITTGRLSGFSPEGLVSQAQGAGDSRPPAAAMPERPPAPAAPGQPVGPPPKAGVPSGLSWGSPLKAEPSLLFDRDELPTMAADLSMRVPGLPSSDDLDLSAPERRMPLPAPVPPAAGAGAEIGAVLLRRRTEPEPRPTPPTPPIDRSGDDYPDFAPTLPPSDIPDGLFGETQVPEDEAHPTLPPLFDLDSANEPQPSALPGLDVSESPMPPPDRPAQEPDGASSAALMGAGSGDPSAGMAEPPPLVLPEIDLGALDGEAEAPTPAPALAPAELADRTPTGVAEQDLVDATPPQPPPDGRSADGASDQAPQQPEPLELPGAAALADLPALPPLPAWAEPQAAPVAADGTPVSAAPPQALPPIPAETASVAGPDSAFVGLDDQPTRPYVEPFGTATATDQPALPPLDLLAPGPQVGAPAEPVATDFGELDLSLDETAEQAALRQTDDSVIDLPLELSEAAEPLAESAPVDLDLSAAGSARPVGFEPPPAPNFAPDAAPADGAVSGRDAAPPAVQATPSAAAGMAPGQARVSASGGYRQIGHLRISIALFDIFLGEAEQLSNGLQALLQAWCDEPGRPLKAEAVSLAHSLAGGSGTVGYAPMSQLARSLEHAMERVRARGHPLGDEPELFAHAGDEIRRLLHLFAAGFLQQPEPGLRDRLELVGRSANEPGPPGTRSAPLDDGRRSSHTPLYELSEFGSSEMTPLSRNGELARSEAMGPDFDDDIDQSDAIDDELLPIFLEEAGELLPRLHASLRSWSQRPGQADPAASAMRSLHTFKGGARLAGAMRLGEMAHRLESGIERLMGQSAPVGAAQVERLVAHADRMEQQFELLRRAAGGEPQPLASDLAPLDAPPPEASAPAAPLPLLMPLDLDDGPPALATPSEPQPKAEAGPGSADVVPSDAPVGAGADEPGSDLVPEPGTDAADVPVDGAGSVLAEGLENDGPVPTVPTVAAAAAAAAAAAPEPDAAEPITPREPPAPRQPEPLRSPDAVDWARFEPVAGALAAEPAAARPVTGTVRVRAAVLDRLVAHAGEVSIARARIEADVLNFKANLGDLNENLERLRSQLRDIELQAESQIASRMEAARAAQAQFDPLEMDRFTRFQEITRTMAESVGDVATVQRSLQRTLQSTEDQLAQQHRMNRDMQDDLLRTRLVEFEGLSERLYRVVRLAAKETGKPVRLDIVGGSIEVDRGVLDRMTPVFEHLLRNSVVHGFEPAAQRQIAGKPPTGTITLSVGQIGNEVAVEVRDDGAGLNLGRILERARAAGLVAADAQPEPAELANLIFQPGLTTATEVTETAGRGVGMDVVRTEVNAIGGRIETASTPGQGTSFRVVLPLTTAVTRVVMLRCGDRQVAVPSTLVESVGKLEASALEAAYDSGLLRVADRDLPFFWLDALLQGTARGVAPDGAAAAIVVIRSASRRVVLHVDEVAGNQEVVVKHLGPQLSRLPGMVGVTLLPTGVPALIYNPVPLANLHGSQAQARVQALMHPQPGAAEAASAEPDRAPLVLVVDDSLTVRRVTQRLLEREGYRVALAKDGQDAIRQLDGERPAVVLSDIEMPRMDGFELLRQIRATARLSALPVIMITSRLAQKHRDYANELGANHYLGKPYGEDELLALVAHHVRELRLLRD